MVVLLTPLRFARFASHSSHFASQTNSTNGYGANPFHRGGRLIASFACCSPPVMSKIGRSEFHPDHVRLAEPCGLAPSKDCPQAVPRLSVQQLSAVIGQCDRALVGRARKTAWTHLKKMPTCFSMFRVVDRRFNAWQIRRDCPTKNAKGFEKFQDFLENTLVERICFFAFLCVLCGFA